MKNTAGLFHKNRHRRDAKVRVRSLPRPTVRLTAGDMLKLGLILLLAVSLAGCSKLGKGTRTQTQTFDGQVFRGSAKPVDKDRADFVASVRQPGKSVDGAVQAAEYQAVKYCITNYGTSDIDWRVGPETPRDQLSISADALTLSGRCHDL